MSLTNEEKTTKQTQIYRQLGQGLKVFHEDQYPDVDILAVPGLGTNPEECWTWKPSHKSGAGRSGNASTSMTTTGESEMNHDDNFTGREHNWIRDKDGLASLFPKSRIMLYDYASAWRGPRKVKATMKAICTWLLDDLREMRKGSTEVGRPLIIIGHSMGGVVIAKMLCMARARREFESILTCTVGCLFFGAPFQGTNMAKIALLYSSVFGLEAYESLLSFMRTEKNDALDEVTNDFMEICTKLVPPIDLFCAYEQVATNVSYSQRINDMAPRLLQHKAFKVSVRAVVDLGSAPFKTDTHFVDEKSAVLQGAHSVGITADHRDLIKFESVSAKEFIPVKAALSTMVRTSKTNARKRVLLSGQSLLSQRAINKVRQSLEGVDMRLKFRTKVNQRSITSWLMSEPLYLGWLARGSPAQNQCSYLWLRGAAGLGKTNASLAAIQEISKTHLDEQHSESSASQSGILMAFFLCEWAPGCNTAEELLQSLITQIINQDESLAQHGARWFVPRQGYRGTNSEEGGGATSAKATATVDNLWRCLQDMLDDPAVDSIHLILNNIHLLESSVSTNALLAKLRGDADVLVGQPPASRRVKWLITSRNDRHIMQCLDFKSISAIDLENDRDFGAKVKGAQRQHARDAVLRLRSRKGYSTDLAWYIRNSIESLSEDENWIDIFCILLGNMPNETSGLTIRKWVKEVSSYNIHRLIDHAWDKILSQNQNAKLEIEELLHALTIAYEPPTMADLAVLTQIEDGRYLADLVHRCSPVLELGSTGEHEGKVVFTNKEFADRLQVTAHGHADTLDNMQKKRSHGLMALRCFKYIQASVKLISAKERQMDVTTGMLRSPHSEARLGETNLIDLDEGYDFYEPEVPTSSSSPDCPYPIKYLFRHLSEGFPDVAQELCEDDPDFWGRSSSLRNAWLKQYQILTNEVKDLSTHGMSALHVAAGIGAKELVSILVNRYGTSALSWMSDDGMTPLHVAAINDHTEVVDALIRNRANIELGDGSSGTALHLAALRGNCRTMVVLIKEGANINASSKEIGPVINAAILSGSVDAVKLIMDGDVRFDLDYTQCDAPLSLSARMSEPALFQDILETGREKWLQNVKLLDQALVAASYNGRRESVRILLAFPHVYTSNTMEKAVLSAATEKKWESVNMLLDHVIATAAKTRWRFRLGDAFYLAATSREEHVEVLGKMWAFSEHDISQEIRDYSLYQATVLRKETTVVWLLETCGASANATADKPRFAESTDGAPLIDYSTALNAAASSGNAELVRSLLVKGATVDGDAGYALQLAASEGHTKVVQTLLEFGAIVNKQVPDSDEIGFFSSTALQAACENKRVEVVHALLARGADPNLGGGPLTNPITAATERGLTEVLMALLEAPSIDVNVSGGTDGCTPLINAATHMSTEIVELLLNHGADINARNAIGDTALIMAALRGQRACVEMLCSHGADVTYRSPQRGLAIQVAAQSHNALCAYVLAEKMAAMIELHRKASLANAATASERMMSNETLSGILAETREQLQVVSKDMEFYQLEKEQMVSMGALQGETYESIAQQMRVIQDERVELLKQLNTTKGQLGLANETISRMRKLLEEERQTNADLRKRQGWTALQDEKEAALATLEQQKQASMKDSRAEEEKREHLYSHIAGLEEDIQTLKEDRNVARTTLEALRKAATAQWTMEKVEKERLQSELVASQKHAEEVQETLAAVQAAANKASAISEPRKTSDSAMTGEDFSDTEARNPVMHPGQDIPGSFPTALPSSSSSPALSPSMNPRSPGFRTIHGQHRPDGSLGGYRPDRAVRRQQTTESLNSSSSRNEPTGGSAPSSPKLAQEGNHDSIDSSIKERPERPPPLPHRPGGSSRSFA